MIKRLGKTKKRKINAMLHKISSVAVNVTKENGAVIVLGNLKWIRSVKGKLLNRIVSTMPYYKLTQYIFYKVM